MASTTISESQKTLLADLIAQGGRLPAEAVDTRSMNALKRKGMVTIKELKKGKQVRVTKEGRKALN
jgi:hypothetical protein